TFKSTKTINVDIWNFWNYAFTGSVVFIVSGNLFFGIVAAVIHTAVSLLIGDRIAYRVQEEHGIPGITIPHGWAVTSVPIIYIVNKILDQIPYVKNIEWK